MLIKISAISPSAFSLPQEKVLYLSPSAVCVIIGRDPIISVGKGLPDAFRGYATSPAMTEGSNGNDSVVAVQNHFEIFE